MHAPARFTCSPYPSSLQLNGFEADISGGLLVVDALFLRLVSVGDHWGIGSGGGDGQPFGHCAYMRDEEERDLCQIGSGRYSPSVPESAVTPVSRRVTPSPSDSLLCDWLHHVSLRAFVSSLLCIPARPPPSPVANSSTTPALVGLPAAWSSRR